MLEVFEETFERIGVSFLFISELLSELPSKIKAISVGIS